MRSQYHLKRKKSNLVLQLAHMKITRKLNKNKVPQIHRKLRQSWVQQFLRARLTQMCTEEKVLKLPLFFVAGNLSMST
ncbi:MAG: hypothetical protein Ta2B_22560 [Termitinemataceae bacterium]|nr:MAG: hypothetical protein Ta2B_22560 [Termitinemataceae bacterium]